MPGPHQKYPIELDDEQVEQLTHLSRSYTESDRQVERARILLLAHRYPDWGNSRIGCEVGCSPQIIRVWRRKWCEKGIIYDSPRASPGHSYGVLGPPLLVEPCAGVEAFLSLRRALWEHEGWHERFGPPIERLDNHGGRSLAPGRGGWEIVCQGCRPADSRFCTCVGVKDC